MPLKLATGFEIGTTAGWITGNAGNRYADEAVGTPSVLSSAPVRNGTYALELNPSAATEYLGWTSAGAIGASQNRSVLLFAFRFPSALPTEDVTLCVINTASAPNQSLFFRNSDDKLVASANNTIGTGAVGPTIVADTWYVVEIKTDLSAATHTMDWWVDLAAQTQSTVSDSATSIAEIRLGGSSNQTMTCRYDDVAIWTDSAAIGGTPFGAHKVIHLGPDTGGSLDVATITTSEWNTFAGATPTLSAWNAATALAAVDERPVGLGASADGFCRITGTDADYVGIPFTSYTLAAGETVAGLRMLACCWAATSTTCTHSFVAYNGSTTQTLLAAADVGTDNSSTAPAWVCKMFPTLADFDAQSELDALQIRFGSTDSTPDAGIHAVYVELLVKEATGNATVTPAVIAVTTSVPQPAVGVGAAPAVAAATAALPAAGVAVGAAPAAVPAVAAAPQPAVSVGAAPAAVAAVAALPAPTSVGQVGDVTVTPAVVATVAALPQPAVGVGVAPAVFASVVSLPQAAIGVGAAPAAIPVVVALPQPAVGVGVVAAVVAAVAALPAAAVGVGAAPATIAVLADVGFGIGVDVGVTPAVVPAVVALPLATAGEAGGGGVTVTPAVIPAATTLPAAAVAVGAAPAVVPAVAALPQPAVGVGAAPAVTPLAAALPQPQAFSSYTALPAVIAVLATLPQAAVGVGAAPPVIVVVVALPQPEQVGEVGGININPAGPTMIGLVVVETDAVLGATSLRGVMPGSIG
jgi:hypothetical protein